MTVEIVVIGSPIDRYVNRRILMASTLMRVALTGYVGSGIDDFSPTEFGPIDTDARGPRGPKKGYSGPKNRKQWWNQ